MTKKLTAILIAAILVLTLATTVFAQDETPEVPACTGDQINGSVVGYDADLNVVTIETEEGLCTVTLSEGEQDYGHPITTLLGNYFNNMTSENLNFEEALASTQVCVMEVADTDPVEYELVPAVDEEGTCPEDATPATLTQDNEDGTFQVVIGEGEEAEEVTVGVEDPAAAEELTGALAGLVVDWGLNEDGSLQDAGDQIGELHDEGVGFGVIVKLYGIADASGIPVEELIAEYQAGASIGDLFAKYGKPALIGVGHVRKDATSTTTADEDMPEDEMVEGVDEDLLAEENDKDKDKDKDNTGICNARDKGGNAKAVGHGDVDCGDSTDGD